jgi:flagellar hook-associated protein 2
MPDIYVPGIKSRLNTDTIIEDLMKVERIPKDRSERHIEELQAQKGYWQELGRRVASLRESARSLYSFQNPFTERVVRSSDESALQAAASRQALEQERDFTVKQTAKADRFLSEPLDKTFKVEAGNYRFRAGEKETSINFRGGTLTEFSEALNRAGRDKIRSSVVTVASGTQSLLIESLTTGANNRLSFGGASEDFAQKIGMTVSAPGSKQLLQEAPLTVEAGKNASIPVNAEAATLGAKEGMMLSFETSTKIIPQDTVDMSPPSGPVMPKSGSVQYGGITIENDPSKVPLPEWTPPPPPLRTDDMVMLSLQFTDGSAAALPVVRDSSGFTHNETDLSGIAAGKTIASIEITNNNTHRDISVRNVFVYDPQSPEDFKPKNAVSTAQDAIVEMDGIEIRRPSNTIDDLIPGVTLTAKAPSNGPVRLAVEPDREGAKEAIISMVGNYNRLVAEINVLTRSDDKIVQELSYLSADEQAEMRKKLGVFSAETSLLQFRNIMQRAMVSPYTTGAAEEITLLSQIGISSDARGTGSTSGYDPSRLRGYLEIDEKALDAALAKNFPAIKQLFGSDTDDDLIIDSGVAYSLENLTKPYVETGGIVTLKTGTIDSKINREERGIATLDRQLAAKEAALKKQYGQMETAFTRMEKMSEQLSQRMQAMNNSR